MGSGVGVDSVGVGRGEDVDVEEGVEGARAEGGAGSRMVRKRQAEVRAPAQPRQRRERGGGAVLGALGGREGGQMGLHDVEEGEM